MESDAVDWTILWSNLEVEIVASTWTWTWKDPMSGFARYVCMHQRAGYPDS